MLNSNEAVETIKWLHDLRFHDKITSGLCPDSADLFTDNLGAVLLSSLYMLEKFEQNVVFDWEVQPIPTPSENYANMLIMTGFGISRQCKDVETAEQFIDHILSKEVQDLIASKNVSCPVRKSSLSHLSPRAKAHIDKIIDPEILNRSILLIDHPKINEIRQILQIETNKVWLNLESSASACRHIARKVNQCLQWHKWKQE
jgi:ABC-type glycerol-3-phosphate transport system substrate-binding protein